MFVVSFVPSSSVFGNHIMSAKLPPPRRRRGDAAIPLLLRTAFVTALCLQSATALPQAVPTVRWPINGTTTAHPIVSSQQNLIPSPSPRSETEQGLRPSQASEGLIQSFGPGLIQSQPPGLINSQPPGLIGSRPPAFISSQPPLLISSQPPIIPSQTPRVISSQSPSSFQQHEPVPTSNGLGVIPSRAPSGPGNSISGPSGWIGSQTGLFPSFTGRYTNTTVGYNVSVTLTPTLSTEEPLKPIPAPTTASGDPDGHHEVPQEDFHTTGYCPGCSPIIEVTATGFEDEYTPPTPAPNRPSTPLVRPGISTPIADHAGPSPVTPPKITITAGPSQVIISKEPTGGNLVIAPITVDVPSGGNVNVGGSRGPVSGGSPNNNGGNPSNGGSPNRNPDGSENNDIGFGNPNRGGNPGNDLGPPDRNGVPVTVIGNPTTLMPGQTVTVDNTPIVMHTTAGRTEIVVDGTQTLTLPPTTPEHLQGAITKGPILAPITVGTATITANPSSQYIIDGQTLGPGGPALTISGTTISLLPSATAVVIDGKTTSLTHLYGAVFTTVISPLLTLNDQVYTANRAGYYVLAPGTTLVPGGPAITVSGTVVSLLPEGTAAVIQGSTSFMQPMTTVVTLTRGGPGFADDEAGMMTSQVRPLGPLQTSKTGAAAGRVRLGVSATGLVLLGGLLGWL
ncbi:hypothetical protein M011DRAFT_325966 [Sporormia fimetaria CBS 119925]|uniref:Uncharacterized protein n=1 Tax=Sporormia fimetaria CBS 119925 TaxID=1340428 RepID=A0A6A6VFV2_9PLEO|nr:hypothetical protein M011DRAFT_325966 [Sporormia fimetaria CBS 119925]